MDKIEREERVFYAAAAHILIAMLTIKRVKFYRVKQGQTLEEIAAAFSVSPWLVIKENGLTEQPFAGQLLHIPFSSGNGYTVQAGDTKALLCGSREKYLQKNGTDVFYIGMRVRI